MSGSSVFTRSGIRISIRYAKASAQRCVVIAPGFFQSKETRTFKRIEEDLRQATGASVLSMDFRGHGRSSGLYTFSAHETEDLKAVLEHARQNHGRVGVLGFSYGGAIALLEQAAFGGIDSLVCVSSPMAASGIEFKWWTPQAFKIGVLRFELGVGCRAGHPFLPKVRALDVVSRAKIPVFFMHGDKDPTVGQRHSQALYTAAAEPKRLKIFKNGNHAEELYRQFPAEFMREVSSWFLETL